MPAYVVVDIAIHDAKQYERYRELAPSRLVVLEFPSADQARAWWDSPEYAPAKAIRQACARTEMLIVEGVAAQPAGIA